MSVILESIKSLESLAEKEAEIVVSYSGGKDSLAVMELCAKTFGTKRIKAFLWFTVPGLELCQMQIDLCRSRWGVDPVLMPHWQMVNAMKEGLWCDATKWADKIPELDLKTAYAYSMGVVGGTICATGMKDADGLRRRHFFANIRDGGDPFWKRLIHPVRTWTKKDVLDYLKVNGIKVPWDNGTMSSGLGLKHDQLCWLHDNNPSDFQKLLKWYPYAGAAIKRRDWFGVN